jgi:hypothetical protein
MNNRPYYNPRDGMAKVTPTVLIKTVASTDTPEAISDTDIFCTKLTIQGQKAVQTDNTSDCYIGWESTNGTQAFLVGYGGSYTWVAPEGARYNLKDWYVDVGTNADGVVCIYE